MQEGRGDDATVAARTALQLDPAYADAHVNLGHARDRRASVHVHATAL